MANVEDQQPPRPLWIRAAVDDDAFRQEQAALGKLWTFVGFTSDIPKLGDWFRTRLGGRSIFVQRFEEGIRAFENRCAHRFYPLRAKDRGNGPVLCGFHHWRYNAEGQAVGIPKCQEMFGMIPREMNARILRLDVDTCGHLIFARFPSDERTDTLQEYLGTAYPILATICAPKRQPHRLFQTIRAHWKFSHHISLDDYHIVAVHPSSFGKQGYLKPGSFQYFRFGPHSAHFSDPDPEQLRIAEQQCLDGTYKPTHYAIYNIFPNLVVTQFRFIDPFNRSHWFYNVASYHPVARNETRVQARFFLGPPTGNEKLWELRLRPYIEPLAAPLVSYFAARIMGEDNHACEEQQSLAHEIMTEQTLSSQEVRVAWFEEAYAAALNGDPLPGERPHDVEAAIEGRAGVA